MSKPLVAQYGFTEGGVEEWGITQKGADILNHATRLMEEQAPCTLDHNHRAIEDRCLVRYPTYQDALIRALFDYEQKEVLNKGGSE